MRSVNAKLVVNELLDVKLTIKRLCKLDFKYKLFVRKRKRQVSKLNIAIYFLLRYLDTS